MLQNFTLKWEVLVLTKGDKFTCVMCTTAACITALCFPVYGMCMALIDSIILRNVRKSIQRKREVKMLQLTELDKYGKLNQAKYSVWYYVIRHKNIDQASGLMLMSLLDMAADYKRIVDTSHTYKDLSSKLSNAICDCVRVGLVTGDFTVPHREVLVLLSCFRKIATMEYIDPEMYARIEAIATERGAV